MRLLQVGETLTRPPLILYTIVAFVTVRWVFSVSNFTLTTSAEALLVALSSCKVLCARCLCTFSRESDRYCQLGSDMVAVYSMIRPNHALVAVCLNCDRAAFELGLVGLYSCDLKLHTLV